MADEYISGISMAKLNFRVHQDQTVVDPHHVLDILLGRLSAYWIHGFMAASTCRQIVSNFWASAALMPRSDGVEGHFVGAYHYGKSTMDYLNEVRAAEIPIAKLYSGTANPSTLFKSVVSSVISPALSVRPAQMNGYYAGDSRALCWTNTGHYLLEPHEDLAQLRNPLHSDFEIQRVRKVLAVTFYPEVPIDSGQIKIWNIQPDDRTRQQLGLQYTGFPYPTELLDSYDALSIPVKTGDACVFNGAQVHAVLRGNPRTSGRRLLITFFMGLLGDNELVWWT